ncbi:MAG: hypothetical protein NC416_13150 [Eubacterium sp.]|nr:hypothetical protein [Eubacterium sp.]
MYDFLKFIDSPDIREYNKNTCFTPAEWAVLVARSYKRTMEEKMDALQYLVDHYTAEEFEEESVVCDSCDEKGDLQSFRDVVRETVNVWKEALAARTETEGVVFEASLTEKVDRNVDGKYWYFSCYEKAWEYLLKKKQEYLDDEDLKDVKTLAKIARVKLDHVGGDSGECYLFDSNMRMVEIYFDSERAFAKREAFDPANHWICHVPLPFQKGDIVKVDFPQTVTSYGVFSCDWKRPEKREHMNMWVSLDTYDEVWKDFDFTDNCPYYDWVLGFSYCTDEELPKDEQVLRLIRAVRKGDIDFYMLLHKFGRNELDDMLKWLK